MDTGELRRQILRALDEARKQTTTQKTPQKSKDEAKAAYATFLETIAAPLVRQATSVLRAEHQPFEAQTPAGSVRLAKDSVPQCFLEFDLDTKADVPQAIGRVSVVRARGGVVVEERPIAAGKPIAELSESDVAAFLVAEIPKLVGL